MDASRFQSQCVKFQCVWSDRIDAIVDILRRQVPYKLTDLLPSVHEQCKRVRTMPKFYLVGRRRSTGSRKLTHLVERHLRLRVYDSIYDDKTLVHRLWAFKCHHQPYHVTVKNQTKQLHASLRFQHQTHRSRMWFQHRGCSSMITVCLLHKDSSVRLYNETSISCQCKDLTARSSSDADQRCADDTSTVNYRGARHLRVVIGCTDRDDAKRER
jgi:hypothetical protein